MALGAAKGRVADEKARLGVESETALTNATAARAALDGREGVRAGVWRPPGPVMHTRIIEHNGSVPGSRVQGYQWGAKASRRVPDGLGRGDEVPRLRPDWNPISPSNEVGLIIGFLCKRKPACRLRKCVAGMTSVKARITCGAAASTAACAFLTRSGPTEPEAENTRLKKLLSEQSRTIGPAVAAQRAAPK